MTPPSWIELCGGIASGKTTLAGIMSRRTGAVMEQFRDNPFWQAFYADRARFAFETEVSFLLQHYHQLKAEASDIEAVTADFSLCLDKAYAEVTLRAGQLCVFNAVYEQVRGELGNPSLLVYLRCGAAEQLKRIRRRRRKPEKAICFKFLEELNRSLDKQMVRVRATVPIIEIDSECRDFAHDNRVSDDVLNEIMAALPVKTQPYADVQLR